MKWLRSARVICTAAALVAVCVSSLSCSTGSISFPDPNLEEAVREAINKSSGPIKQSDLSGITALFAGERNIADLTGIEYCTNLDTLHLQTNYLISDITPLSGLTGLTALHLDYNQINDISALSKLNNLRKLSLGDNQISDITPLSGLTNLQILDLYDNQIIDVTALAGLEKLDRLWLWNNPISDIKPLVDNAGLSSGDTVSLKNNPLSTTSVNTYIPQLKSRGVEVIY